MSPTPQSLLVFSALHLGQLLVSSRKHAKLTQRQVAARMGLSQNRLSHLERHADELSFAQLLSYCSAVGLDIRLEKRDTSKAVSTEW